MWMKVSYNSICYSVFLNKQFAGVQEIFLESEPVETGQELFVGIFGDVRRRIFDILSLRGLLISNWEETVLNLNDQN